MAPVCCSCWQHLKILHSFPRPFPSHPFPPSPPFPPQAEIATAPILLQALAETPFSGHAAPLLPAIASILHLPSVIVSRDVIAILAKEEPSSDAQLRLCRPVIGLLELYLSQFLQTSRGVAQSCEVMAHLNATVDVLVEVGAADSADAVGQAALTLFLLTSAGPTWAAPSLVRGITQLVSSIPPGSGSLQPLLAAVQAQARHEVCEPGMAHPGVLTPLPHGSHAKLPVAQAVFSRLPSSTSLAQRQAMVDVIFAAQRDAHHASASSAGSAPPALTFLAALLDVPLGSQEKVPLSPQRYSELGQLLEQHPFDDVARVVLRLAQRSLQGLIPGRIGRVQKRKRGCKNG